MAITKNIAKIISPKNSQKNYGLSLDNSKKYNAVFQYITKISYLRVPLKFFGIVNEKVVLPCSCDFGV